MQRLFLSYHKHKFHVFSTLECFRHHVNSSLMFSSLPALHGRLNCCPFSLGLVCLSLFLAIIPCPPMTYDQSLGLSCHRCLFSLHCRPRLSEDGYRTIWRCVISKSRQTCSKCLWRPREICDSRTIDGNKCRQS